MKFSWKDASAFLAVLALALSFASCGGGTTGSTLSSSSGGSGSGSSGGSGSGSGSGSGGGSGSGSGSGGSNQSACSTMSTGLGASLNGFVPFATDSPWNKDISASPADANSSAIINFIGPTIGLHPDFGSGGIGIPYAVVSGTQSPVSITFGAYGDESDPGPMPIPGNAPIEGGAGATGDRHVLVLDNSRCFLYELFGSVANTNGSWNADSAAVWDLLSNQQRPWTWTSADAAGLPIFPGLVRYDEVAAGEIQHAIRFTLPASRAAMVPPAAHWASNSTNANAAPMGMRLRLKAGYDISGFTTNVKVILTAMKRYGLIMADNGSTMYITGAPDNRWDNDELHDLSQVPASAFEVVQMSPVYTASSVPQGAAPGIASFTATPSSGAGSNVTLSWSVSNASYVIVSPQVGAVRGTSVTVTPGQTTTYTLYATNQYDRSTATVTVTVP